MKSNYLSWRRVLDKLIELVYLTTIFLVPLWFAYLLPTYNIFEFNKMGLFRILVFSLFFFTTLKIILYQPRLGLAPRAFFKKYWLLPLIFLVGLGLSLLFSNQPAQSFYGTIERQLGYYSYLLFFLWFLLLSFNILTVQNKAGVSGNIRRILLAIFWSGLVASVYGILQILNIDFLVWPEPPYLTHRIFSTFGQPNFLASWLLLVIPVSVYLFLTSRSFLLKSFFLGAVGLQLLALFLTGSRGGLVAFILAGALGLVYYLFKTTWSKRKKLLVVGLFIFLVLLVVIGLDVVSRGRVRELANPNRGSLAARSLLYTSAIDAISQSPWVGYGLDHGEEVFIKYYSRDWGIYGNVNQSADHAHNFILDILLTTGVYGLVFYSLLACFVFRLVKSGLKNSGDRWLVLALTFGLLAYYFSLFFSFTIVVGELYIWLFLALLVANQVSASQSLVEQNTEEKIKEFSVPQLVFNLTVVLLIMLFTAIQIKRAGQDIVADYYFNQIYFAVSGHDYMTALALDDYLREQKVNLINQAGYDRFWGDNLSSVYGSIDQATVKESLRKKLQQIEVDLPTQGYKNLLVKAKINTTLGNYQTASNYLKALFKVAPFWPAAYIEAGRAALARGDSSGALVNYYQAALNLPDPFGERLNAEHKRDVINFQSFVSQQIAEIYMLQTNYGAAEKYYQAAYRYQPADFTLLKKIADTYYLRGDLNTAIRYNERGWRRSPSDYHWPLALAALYLAQGNAPQAEIYIKQARNLSPSSPEIIAWPEAVHNQK